MKRLNRRSFLKSTALTAAAFSLPARSWAQVEGSNSDVRVAVVGFGGRGGSHISEFGKMEGVRLTALCDVDEKILKAGVTKLDKEGKKVDAYTDFRKMLESKNIDVVSIGTPNHWHSLGGIWAIQAGKDVYVEKPVSHNVWEGRKFVEAARKYKRIVQAGTQSRASRGGLGEAVEWVKAGNLGKIVVSRGLCYKRRPSIGRVNGAQPIPKDIDYDLWCGPADKLPLMRQKLHYDWHWVWNTGNGDLGNQGIHQMDICRWFLGEMELAPTVLSVGGRLGYIDDGETANTQIVYQGYEKAPLIFEVRGLPQGTGSRDMDKLKGASVGCIIECEGGSIAVPSYTQSTAFDKEGKEIRKFTGSDNHFKNFIKAVLNRRPEDLYADILEGHLSSALCHTGNISQRLGATRDPEQIKAAMQSHRGMAESVDRMIEHLGKNGVDLEKERLTLGAPLKMDPKTETFADDEVANAMLSRNYREPYVVPARV